MGMCGVKRRRSVWLFCRWNAWLGIISLAATAAGRVAKRTVPDGMLVLERGHARRVRQTATILANVRRDFVTKEEHALRCI
jgi:hypothetical protein